MTEYHLRRFWNLDLYRKCAHVDDFSTLDNLIDAMSDILSERSGAGIAAPQVGDNRQVIMIDLHLEYLVMVNPRVIESKGHAFSVEGCMSIPLFLFPKIRSEEILVEYNDAKGYRTKKRFSGFYSFAVQHEIDHLHGKLIFQYLKHYRKEYEK